MNAIALNFSDFIQVHNNQTVTTSEFIATSFKKRHDNVMQSIDALLAEIPTDFAHLAQVFINIAIHYFSFVIGFRVSNPKTPCIKNYKKLHFRPRDVVNKPK